MRSISDYSFEIYSYFFTTKIPKDVNFNILGFFDIFYDYCLKPFNKSIYIYDKKDLKETLKNFKPIFKYFDIEIENDEFRKVYNVNFTFKKYRKIFYSVNVQFFYDKEMIVHVFYDKRMCLHRPFTTVPEQLSKLYYNDGKIIDIWYSINKNNHYSSIEHLYFKHGNEYFCYNTHVSIEDDSTMSIYYNYDSDYKVLKSNFYYVSQLYRFDISRINNDFVVNKTTSYIERVDLSQSLVNYLNETQTDILNLTPDMLKISHMMN